MEGQGTIQQANLEEIIKAAKEAAATQSKEWILSQIRGEGPEEQAMHEVHSESGSTETAREEEAASKEPRKLHRNAGRDNKKRKKEEHRRRSTCVGVPRT
ncbi:hypothetical protein NDU88_011313 [Pleurodeles waltl]|uniref:Uncharacterized protein n=1 Tax=Pleurodeles waltl TaxID=8319 RepID=A0AAV7QX91_PLEWA|nr:hypothetical protein NDU88_011313 [Pleurodeles waltl]